MDNKKTFVEGAFVLGIAGVIIKLMGFAFRIPLGNMIGDTGMGYYQAAYPIYVFLLLIAIAGIPIAISKMVSERIAVGNYHEAYRVFRISFLLLFGIGISSFSICFFASGLITEYLGVPNARYAMMAIAPALMLCPMMAAYRGYFQGMQNMTPTAASQVMEQLFRVITGLALAFLFLSKGVQFAAAGASFGATAGGVAGLLTIMYIYRVNKVRFDDDIRRSKEQSEDITPNKKILKDILIIAIPITIGASIMPIMNVIDVGIVVRRLTLTGWTAHEATSLYGQLSGFVGPLINFPQVLTQAVSMSLVPVVAAAYKRNDIDFVKKNVELGMRIALLIGFPCAFGMIALSEPLMKTLYPFRVEAAISAASLLVIMGVGVIFLSTVQTLTGVLQGIGRQLIPVRNLAIGALAKVFITYTLTGVVFINVKGAAIGTVSAYIIASTLNIFAVKKYTGAKFNIRLTYMKPIAASLVMAICALGSYHIMMLTAGRLISKSMNNSGTLSIFLPTAVSTLAGVLVGAVLYIVMILKLKAITKEELSNMRSKGKLGRFIDKFVK